MRLSWQIAHAGDLRIATWNLEHLNDEHGEGCVERTEEDFVAIARRIEALASDVVAFQEVENEPAATRVFDPSSVLSLVKCWMMLSVVGRISEA